MQCPRDYFQLGKTEPVVFSYMNPYRRRRKLGLISVFSKTYVRVFNEPDLLSGRETYTRRDRSRLVKLD